jgi:hypothetical protein
VHNDAGKQIGGLNFELNRPPDGKPAVQVRGVNIDPAERGNGYGAAAYRRVANYALNTGQELWSDRSLSPEAERMYQSLGRRGYTAEKTDPNAWPSAGAQYKVTAGPDSVQSSRAPIPAVQVKEISPAVTGRADEYPDLAANPDPVGVATRFPDGGISVHLGNGEWEDIERTPGAFTAVRLWPADSTGIEDYRLYDHTGKQVAHADVAIVGDHAHIANIEAEDGVNTPGIKALRILQTKLKEEFPELTSVKGLRSSGAGPGRTQEVEFQQSTTNESEPLDRITASANAHRHDFDSAVARLSAETGLPHTPAASGEFVAGIYRQSLTLTSGQFAVIDNGLGFALVPWTAELDKHLGRHVSGVAMESDGIEWSFGRKRGLEI